MLSGSCLCGRVHFELDGAVDVINYCHCSRCRRRTGSAFATILHARLADFRFVSGEDQIQTFEGDRAFKLGSGITSEYGRYVKYPGGAP